VRNVMVDTQLCKILQQSRVLVGAGRSNTKHMTHDGAKVSVNRHFQKVITEQYYRQFRPFAAVHVHLAMLRASP
jgi:hypothetical protein